MGGSHTQYMHNTSGWLTHTTSGLEGTWVAHTHTTSGLEGTWVAHIHNTCIILVGGSHT